MIVLTNAELVTVFFMPFMLDNMRENANSCGNLAWYGITSEAIWHRNAFYVFSFLFGLDVYSYGLFSWMGLLGGVIYLRYIKVLINVMIQFRGWVSCIANNRGY